MAIQRITSGIIADGAIVATDIGDGVVTASKIADANVTSSKLASSLTISANTGSAAAPSIFPTGDTNTGIFFPAADTIAFAEGGAEAMRIDSDGDVGIGTSSPASRLHVSDAVAGGQVLVTTNETNSTSKIGSLATMHYTNAEEPVLAISVEGGASENIVQIGGGPGEFNASTSIRFFTAANSTTTGGTERMRIDSSGNVGINTTSPAAKLHVAVPDGSIQARFERTSTGVGYFEMGGSGGAFTVWPNGFGATYLEVDTSGNLTITGSTATKASGTTWANPSDQRLKDNIRDYTKGIAELMQVRVREWEYNGKGGTREGMSGLGVVADEIISVLPDTVDTYESKLDEGDEETSEIKRFDATEITWLLVNAIKELKAELDEAKARIAALEQA
jgi:hypothetical protein